MEKYDTAVDLGADTSQTRLIRLAGHDRTVLDIGCATGYVAKVLSDQFGCTVTGLERDRQAAEQAAKVCQRVIVGDAETLDYREEFGDQKFDVILFADVLEHFRDPKAVLMQVRGLLAPGGFVLASIPNVAHGSVALDLLKGNFTYRPLGLLDEGHLRFFAKKSLHELFEAAGYLISELQRLHQGLEQTELQVDPARFPAEVVAFAMQNDEATTYQFVVKAYPTTEGGTIDRLRQEVEKAEGAARASRAELEALAVELERAREQLDAARVERSRLEHAHAALAAQSAWMHGHPVWRTYLGARLFLVPRGSRREDMARAVAGWFKRSR
jgi:2-polyprenyl-3-methyl-5-hydroxy-6-metoxy-1,4-benzoquinol methylase